MFRFYFPSHSFDLLPFQDGISARASSISTSSLCPHSVWPSVWPPTVLPSFLLFTFTSSSSSFLSSLNAFSVVSTYPLPLPVCIHHSMSLQKTASAWSPSASSSRDSSKMPELIGRLGIFFSALNFLNLVFDLTRSASHYEQEITISRESFKS